MKNQSKPSYKIKYVNEDFIVDEVSLLPRASDIEKGTFSYIRVDKCNFTTFEAQEMIKEFFQLDYSDVVFQGLKDEDAVTSQLFSIKKIVKSSNLIMFNKEHASQKDHYVKISRIEGFGRGPVKERCLHGNTFTITVRGLSNKVAKNIKFFCGDRLNFAFVNYYDNQRFGMSGGPYNSHIIGRLIVENERERAVEEILKTNDSKYIREISNDNKRDVDYIFKHYNPSKLRFYVNSYSSFLWNKDASSRIKHFNNCDKVIFDNVGSLCVPEDSNFTADTVLKSKGFHYNVNDRKVVNKTKIRNLITQTVVYCSTINEDPFEKNKKSLALSFFLPTGSYATMMVRQLIYFSSNHN